MLTNNLEVFDPNRYIAIIKIPRNGKNIYNIVDMIIQRGILFYY